MPEEKKVLSDNENLANFKEKAGKRDAPPKRPPEVIGAAPLDRLVYGSSSQGPS